MNKIILEKLLHTYKLIGEPNTKKREIDGKEYYVVDDFFERFFAEWELASHIDIDKIAKDRTVDGYRAIDYTLFYKHFRSFSNTIQESQKFYMDLTRGSGLNEDEMEKIRPDISYHMPFEECFLQCQIAGIHKNAPDGNNVNLSPIAQNNETDVTMNLLVKEDNESEVVDVDGSISNRLFHITCVPYIAHLKKFVFDPNVYSIKYHDDGSFTFWLQEDPELNPWINTVDTQADSTGRYTNQSLNIWVQQISNVLCTFFAMMSFPQINRQKKVKGLSPRILESQSAYKFSELVSKPTWEHKTLVLDMYDNVPRETGRKVHREGGVRFHARRKHLRRLPSGKYTFVKATFVGTKDKGVVSKDYIVK